MVAEAARTGGGVAAAATAATVVMAMVVVEMEQAVEVADMPAVVREGEATEAMEAMEAEVEASEVAVERSAETHRWPLRTQSHHLDNGRCTSPFRCPKPSHSGQQSCRHRCQPRT